MHAHSHSDRHSHRHHHSHDSFSIDQCAYQSGLLNVNPGFKTAFALLTLCLLLTADNLFVSVAVFLSMYYLTVCRGRLLAIQYLEFLSFPAFFALMTTIIIAAGFSSSPCGDYCVHLGFFYLYTTAADLTKAFYLLCKVFAAVSCMYFLSLSTPLHEIIQVLHTCRCPSLLTELMNMIYRFIFILMEVQLKMNIAARSRLGYISYRTSLHTFGCIGANLFIISMKKAAQYYDALLARCYNGQLCFLTEEKPLKTRHLICAAVYFLLLTAVWLITKPYLM